MCSERRPADRRPSQAETGRTLSEKARPALPECIYEILAEKCERVCLPSPKLLFRARESPRYAHFLLSGTASLATVLQDGRGTHVGLLGPGCLVETYQLLGPASVFLEANMELAGSALRLPFRELELACKESQALQLYISRQRQTNGLVASQLVACNSYHDLQPRLASLLLILQENARGAVLQLTQESLATMLGVRRTTLTVTAGALQRQGILHYSRGLIEICDRARLSTVACECYGVLGTIGSYGRLL